MNQINPNLKTLGQLISKVNFCDWFFNTNYLETQQTPVNAFAQNAQWSPSSMPGYLLNCPVIAQFWSNINQYTFNQNAWTVQLPNLLGMIYDLFKNAIPYDQTTFSTQIQPSWNTGSNSQNITINALDTMTQISAYLGLYINRIVEWCVLMWKYNTQLSTLYSGYTNSYAYNTMSGHASQGQQLNINSFDPVETSPTVTPTNLQVQEPSYTMGIGSNSMSNATAAQLNSNSVTITNGGANWNNNGAANVSNSSQAATNQAINLENMATIGQGDNMSLLRPLIKKISSLFWSLGNDYYPDNINWGFNIW